MRLISTPQHDLLLRLSVRPLLVAVLGPTATGKSALALALAERYDGEIINCDSTAVYRGFDIGTDKVPIADRRGIPHHLIDIVDPTDEYTAAQYAARCGGGDPRHPRARAAADSRRRHRLLLSRADARPLSRSRAAMRRCAAAGGDRASAAASRFCIGCCGASIRRRRDRIQPRDLKRMVRALEVFFLTGRPLTEHFADTASPIPESTSLAIGAAAARPLQISERVARRVDEQFERGLLDEIRALLASGVPETARPFGGLVYRQALEHLHGVRDEASTRALIAQENRRYARRQLIWFRKEPNLDWLDGPGESPRRSTSGSRWSSAPNIQDVPPRRERRT